MLRSTLHTITALAVAWHAVGGCAGHHVHASTGTCGHVAAGEGHLAHVCGHPDHSGHRHGANETERPQTDETEPPAEEDRCPADCCQGSCAFALPKILDLDPPGSLAGQFDVIDLCALVTAPSTSRRVLRNTGLGAAADPLSLRRHLALSVMRL